MARNHYNVGVMFYAPNNITPDEALPCNGNLVSKIQYSELFGVIKYQYGGEGEYFALPKILPKEEALYTLYIKYTDITYWLNNGL